MTAYGTNYFEIKNSWGQDWANNGYAKLARGRDICGILSYAYYVDYKNLSGESADEPDTTIMVMTMTMIIMVMKMTIVVMMKAIMIPSRLMNPLRLQQSFIRR